MTQFMYCFAYKHQVQRCKVDHPVCPICSLSHCRSEHRCTHPTYPREGNTKVVPAYCPDSLPNSVTAKVSMSPLTPRAPQGLSLFLHRRTYFCHNPPLRTTLLTCPKTLILDPLLRLERLPCLTQPHPKLLHDQGPPSCRGGSLLLLPLNSRLMIDYNTNTLRVYGLAPSPALLKLSIVQHNCLGS